MNKKNVKGAERRNIRFVVHGKAVTETETVETKIRNT